MVGAATTVCSTTYSTTETGATTISADAEPLPFLDVDFAGGFSLCFTSSVLAGEDSFLAGVLDSNLAGVLRTDGSFLTEALEADFFLGSSTGASTYTSTGWTATNSSTTWIAGSSSTYLGSEAFLVDLLSCFLTEDLRSVGGFLEDG